MTFSIGPSCDDGKTWQLCGDTCKNASCTSNPDANCVAPMGGCGPDACKPKFYNRMGKEAQCKRHRTLKYRVVVLWFIVSMFGSLEVSSYSNHKDSVNQI